MAKASWERCLRLRAWECVKGFLLEVEGVVVEEGRAELNGTEMRDLRGMFLVRYVAFNNHAGDSRSVVMLAANVLPNPDEVHGNFTRPAETVPQP